MDETESSPPAGWLDALARSKAQIEAGECVPMEPFLDRLRASIARMEAQQRERPKLPARKARSRLAPEAEAQLGELLRHYERLNRIAAAHNLQAALVTASNRILTPVLDEALGLAEPALAANWLRPEVDEAWARLQRET